MYEFIKTGPAVLQGLDVEETSGLTAAQVKANREKYGENAFTREKPVSLVRRILDAVKEPMLIMLVLAGIIALGVNITLAATGQEADFLECAGIFAAISLSVIITVVMEGRSMKAFETLSKLNENVTVKVLRDGQTVLINQKELVAGDIVFLETGDKCPADGRLLESTALYADESSLTGESVPVEKQYDIVFEDKKTPVAERINMLYSGCFITSGNGKMVVTAVGDQTEFGKIAKELSSAESSQTPLQEKLAKLGKGITFLGAMAAAIVFVVQIVTFINAGTLSFALVSEAFITSIVLIVAAVPEGLPTIVAVSLSINIIKMSKNNSLVKKMIACETVGCINVICSDKTGTLTENKMTVTDIFSEGAIQKPEQLENAYLIHNICVNSTADISKQESGYSFIGNPTECALLAAADKSDICYQECREKADVLYLFPFSSETKNMTVIVAEAEGPVAYTKGSPEKIIEMCQGMENREEVEEKIRYYQEKACRIIGFAHKAVSEAAVRDEDRDQIEAGMHFDGFAVITDPLREDVYQAVEKCRQAGIDLKMLTGDNIITATAIADELHILDEKHIAVEARELEALSDEELKERLPQIRVIARSTPLIKMRVVKALKAQGNVVAVTGDGINDAPAIKNADVGIAMGIAGTEVSKQASDIVLLDDSFSTIVRAIQWGRGIYENFQRFIQFQLTVNLSSVIVVLSSILMGFAAPFSALQLLWVNIIMDGPPALTLGLEPIRGDLMDREPTARNAAIVSKEMLFKIVINGVFISIVFLLQLQYNFLGIAREQQSTVLFTLFVVFQLFNAFCSRELGNTSIFRNFRNNKLMLSVFGLTFALQVIITQFGGAFFGTVGLSVLTWGKIIATAFSVILLSELVKFTERWRMAAVCRETQTEKA